MKTVDEMMQLNHQQATFYDAIHEADIDEVNYGYSANRRANWLTRSWAKLRSSQQVAIREAGIENRIRDHHLQWMKACAGGDFLEVGCFSGSRYTTMLAEHAGNYLGVELSPRAVASLNAKFAAAGMESKAKAEVVDFLAMPADRKFDLIYAHGVLHHFQNPVPLFSKLASLAHPDTILLFVDPIAIHPLYRLIRGAYRPFQSDAEWEWPFNRKTVQELEKHFEIVDGFGWGAWSLPISVLTGLPFVGQSVLRRYVAMVKQEVSKGWSGSVWYNSMVTAAYRPKKGGH